MIIIPAGKRLDWRHPPIVTLLLVALNVLAFVFIQGQDNQRIEEALSYYSSSSLPKTELPRYLDYRERNGERVSPVERLRLRERKVLYPLVMEMESDAVFMQQLHDGQIVRSSEPVYARWSEERATFEEMEQRVSIHRYGFRPANPTLSGVLGHMFMHGGFGHLFGNMLFLFLVGVMVEQVLGKRLFLLSYFVGGLCAVGLFGLVYSDSNTPLVGASGAIAGLMGLYTVCFGMRKVEFFYSVLFYFDYVKAPAILLLPLWIGNEFYQLQSGENAHVAYMAHIGGLASGALLGAAYRKWLPQRFAMFHTQEERKETFESEFQRGQKLLGEMKFEQAQHVFSALLDEYPDNRALLDKIYNIAKLRPDGDNYHRAAMRIFELKGEDAGTAERIYGVYQEYLKLAKPQPRLTAESVATLAMRFARNGHAAEAEKLTAYLMRKQPQNPTLPALLFWVAKAHFRAGNPEKYQSYLHMVGRLYPDAKEASIAADLLRQGV